MPTSIINSPLASVTPSHKTTQTLITDMFRPTQPNKEDNEVEPANVIKIGTLNCQSSADEWIDLIILLMNEKQLDILCLQDTGKLLKTQQLINRSKLKLLNTQHPDVDSSGYMAVICTADIRPLLKEHSPQLPRTQTIELQTKKGFKILNIYGSNNPTHFHEFIKEQATNHEILVVGDLNSYPNTYLDKYSNLTTSFEQKSHLCRDLEKLKLKDIFRLHHPHTKKYTRWGIIHQSDGQIRITASRIDHIYSTKKLSKRTKEIDIEEQNCTNSDHRLVWVNIRWREKITANPIESERSKEPIYDFNDDEGWIKFTDTVNQDIDQNPIFNKRIMIIN